MNGVKLWRGNFGHPCHECRRLKFRGGGGLCTRYGKPVESSTALSLLVPSHPRARKREGLVLVGDSPADLYIANKLDTASILAFDYGAPIVPKFSSHFYMYTDPRICIPTRAYVYRPGYMYIDPRIYIFYRSIYI